MASWHEEQFSAIEALVEANQHEKATAKVKEIVETHDYDEWYHLECKEVKDWSGHPTRPFKGILAKTVSGLANAGGGLIIWGYEVKSDSGTGVIHRLSATPSRLTTFSRL